MWHQEASRDSDYGLPRLAIIDLAGKSWPFVYIIDCDLAGDRHEPIKLFDPFGLTAINLLNSYVKIVNRFNLGLSTNAIMYLSVEK